MAASGLYLIEDELDAALGRLGDTILQTATLGPQEAHGGYIVVQKPKARPPYVLELSARWNDEDYRFRFDVRAAR